MCTVHNVNTHTRRANQKRLFTQARPWYKPASQLSLYIPIPTIKTKCVESLSVNCASRMNPKLKSARLCGRTRDNGDCRHQGHAWTALAHHQQWRRSVLPKNNPFRSVAVRSPLTRRLRLLTHLTTRSSAPARVSAGLLASSFDASAVVLMKASGRSTPSLGRHAPLLSHPPRAEIMKHPGLHGLVNIAHVLCFSNLLKTFFHSCSLQLQSAT